MSCLIFLKQKTRIALDWRWSVSGYCLRISMEL